MRENGKCLKKKITIHAPALEIFNAFTNAAALSDWLCSIAHATPLEGGGIYLWWPDQTYVVGEYVQIKPWEKIVFTWHGNGEPARSQVEIRLKRKDNNDPNSAVKISVAHCGIHKGKDWKAYRKRIKIIWEAGLENLKSFLETGHDLRIEAHLRDLGWEAPELPATIEEIGENARLAYERINALHTHAAPDSAEAIQDLFAHAIVLERRLHAWIEALLNGQDPAFLDPGESEIQASAAAASFPTLTLLREELRHNQIETLAILQNIPAEIYAARRKFWLLSLKVKYHITALEKKFTQQKASTSSADRIPDEKEVPT